MRNNLVPRKESEAFERLWLIEVEKKKELLEACKEASKEIKEAFEDYATKESIECDMGVSEWKSFLPKSYHVLQRAIDKAEGNG